MPREFIPNVDDANAEITRLDEQVAALSQEKTQAAKDVTTLKASLSTVEADKTTAAAEVVTLTAAETKAKGELLALQAEKAKLEKELAAAKSQATTTIAKSGTLPAKEAGTAGGEDVDRSAKSRTGLQRAIAANQARMAAKSQ